MSDNSGIPPMPAMPAMPPMPPMPPSGFPEGPHGFSNVMKAHFSTVFKMRFRGRASQGEYWWPVLVYAIAGFVIASVTPNLPIVRYTWQGFVFAVFLTLGVRRLHDRNRSGVFILFNLVGYLFLFIAILLSAIAGFSVSTESSGNARPGLILGGLFALLGLGLLVTYLILLIPAGTPEVNKYGNPR